jgi:hypothetical protein
MMGVVPRIGLGLHSNLNPTCLAPRSGPGGERQAGSAHARLIFYGEKKREKRRNEGKTCDALYGCAVGPKEGALTQK